MLTGKRVTLTILITMLLLTLLSACKAKLPEGVVAPLAAEPDKFQVELFADLSDIYPPDEERPEYKFFALTINKGDNGFKPGLYVTGGPFPPPRGTEIYRVDSSGKISVVVTGFESNETMLFARGQYGEGMLVTEPRQGRIRRVLANPDGTGTLVSEPVAVVGDPSFGPIVITYGPDLAVNPMDRLDEVLYVTYSHQFFHFAPPNVFYISSRSQRPIIIVMQSSTAAFTHCVGHRSRSCKFLIAH